MHKQECVALMNSAAAKMTSFRRADGSAKRVLYAEDQTTSRIVTTAMLQRMGFEVHAVEDGELALQAAANDTYDVILLDIEMPNMDGVTAARSIRAQLQHCNDTPILAMSAFLADSTESCVWRDAFDSALPKPANTNELHKALTHAIGLKNLASVAEQPKHNSFALALRESLSPGSWQRLKATAAEEMHRLLLTISAAREAKDSNLQEKCVNSLKVLIMNFEAPQILALLNIYTRENSAIALRAVYDSIARW
jgi:CheY-like chemotaxis protein